MATITLHQPNRYEVFTVLLAEYYGAQTTTAFEVISRSGTVIEASAGTGFTYGSNGFFNRGTINEIYLFSDSGRLTFSATGLDLDVRDRNATTVVGKDAGDYYRAILSGDDVITGSSGDDLVFGSAGKDAIDGGAGRDVLYYNGLDSNVIVDLAAGTAETAFGLSSVTRIEDVTGSAGDDTIGGDKNANVLQGLAGNDYLDGRSGFDTASYLDARAAVTVDLAAGTASGGSGNDTLVSIERVIGTRFDDTLLGSSRADTFSGSFGNDTINGRGGIDTVEYDNVGRGVGVDLAEGVSVGGAGNDTLISIENVSGSLFGDTLLGSRGANVLRGGDGGDAIGGREGADKLFGDKGDDLLSGGLGADSLTGGAGKDSFRFDSALGSANIDRITDFRVVDDTIELDRTIFATFGTTGALAATAFKSIATGGAIDGNDRIVYNRTTGALFYDANGSTNGLGDAIQFATLGKDLALTASDFVVI